MCAGGSSSALSASAATPRGGARPAPRGGLLIPLIWQSHQPFITVAALEISSQVRLQLKRRTATGLKEIEEPGRLPGSTNRGSAASFSVPGLASRQKYQRILDAAVEVIGGNSYFNLPISAIRARAGVADGTIYPRLKNKDDVLCTADTIFDGFQQHFYKRFESLTDPREQMEQIAAARLETATKSRSKAILMQTAMRQSANRIAEFSHKHLVRHLQVVREMVLRGRQAGIFRRDVSDGLVAHCLFSAIDELLSSAVFTRREYNAQATAKQVLNVLLNGIGADAAQPLRVGSEGI